MSGSNVLLWAVGLLVGYSLVTGGGATAGPQAPIDGKNLGVIVNQDDNGFLIGSPGKDITAGWYQDAVLLELMLAKPGVYAQCVGFPDPVNYRTKVATTMDKYCPDHWSAERSRTQRDGLRRLFELDTDILTLASEACRQQGVLCVASYRMNSEDWGELQLDVYDFGRAHKDWAIPGANCLDPAIPEVYQHRMNIFREVAENYDIDGIEFDFRRWYRMISDPLENYPILTQMVRDTRRMLDEVAKQKGRKKLLLGARVGISIAGKPLNYHELSCKDLGLDVKTWIEEGLVDYLCPAMFHGGVGRAGYDGAAKEYLKVAEFVELAKNSGCGIYPTIWSYIYPKTGEKAKRVGEGDAEAMRRYRDAMCESALDYYGQGTDGMSTFNWHGAVGPQGQFGIGAQKIAIYIHSKLGDPEALRRCLSEERAVPEGFALPWEAN